MPNERQYFWYNLEKIKNGLLLSDAEFAKFIGISLVQYTKNKNSMSFLPLAAVYDLAEKLNFHFTDLMGPDFGLNYSSFSEDKPMPERYTRAAYSKLTPTKNILNYLELTRGTRAKMNLIRKFQLSESYVQNENNRTNILLVSDIVKYLSSTYNFTEREFMAMGQRTPFTFTSSLLKDKLSDHKDIYGVLEAFFEECTQIFDVNCQYRISEIVNDFAIIEVLPKRSVIEELQVKQTEFGNEQVCLTRMGCISSMTWFKYKRNARVEKISSVYEGDATNKYLMDLSPFKRLSSSPSASILDFKSIH